VARNAESTAARLAGAARVRSDRTRAVYVALRRASTPVRSLKRTRIARSVGSVAHPIAEDRGFAIHPPGTFPETAEIVEFAGRVAAEADYEELAKRGKDFMLPLLTPGDLDRDNPLIRFALRPDVLASVTSYLGVAPILAGANVYRSTPGSRDRYISSQLLHCDGDDTRQIKIFVLCGPVGPENGPTVILDAARSKALRDRVDYQYRNRVEDDEARRVMGDDFEVVPLVGEAGTSCFVDTSRCFHYGSRVDSDANARLVAIIQYLTPYSFMLPREYRSHAPFRRLAGSDSSELELLALGAD
jgi:hypothetical protein